MDSTRNQENVNQNFSESFDGDPCEHAGTDDLFGPASSHFRLDGGRLTIEAVELPAGSGITFPMNRWDVGDILYNTYQSNHGVVINSTFDDHIHCCTSADPTGKRVAFKVDVVFAGVGSAFAVPVGSPFTNEYTFTSDWSLGNFLLDIFETSVGLNPTVSSLIKLRIERIAPTVDTLVGTADLFLEYHDAHVKWDQPRGSRLEYVK